MFKPKSHINGIKLPFKLQQELGIDSQSEGRSRCRWNTSTVSRKDQRKAARVDKRTARNNGPRPPKQQEHQAVRNLKPYSEETAVSEEHNNHTENQQPARKHSKPKHASPPRPKSILKKPAPKSISSSENDEEDDDYNSGVSSPGLVIDSSSKAFKERVAREDAEIAALERRLGVKNKKKATGDGFDDLLEGLDSGDESRKRKHEGRDWLERKRKKTLDGLDEDGDTISEPESKGGFLDNQLLDEVEGSRESFSGFDSDTSNVEPKPKKVRENPYAAPTTSVAPADKYIPPSLRKRSDEDSESLLRLRRKMQGHLNKLSEANLVSILGEIEKMYQENPRQDVTSTFVDLILTTFCNRSALSSTFVILHAAFVSATYRVMGNDFGAEMISKLVMRLDSFLPAEVVQAGKESNNLISLLCYLFTFDVISSTLIFDYIRLLLAGLSESNAELLLRIVRDCGSKLRQDDSSALKSIIEIMRNAEESMKANGQKISVRTDFMIETITNLKNNKTRKGAAGVAGIVEEHVTRMRKVLGSLNRRSRASEPLSISREDVVNSDKKGKWWLVGASWKGNDPQGESQRKSRQREVGEDETIFPEEPDYLELAKGLGMNTDVRRSIFVAVMSAVDQKEAYMRLTKLRLKRSQEQEVPQVLLRCCAAEHIYNPFYAVLAGMLCTEKKMKMSFQFTLWSFFKRMGEKGDDESDDEEDASAVELSEMVNVAKMYASLIRDDSLTLGVLKVLELPHLKSKANLFVELMLVTILTGNSIFTSANNKNSIERTFDRAVDTPQIIPGLQHFLKKHVRKSDLHMDNQKVLLRHYKVAEQALSRSSIKAVA